MSRYDDGGRIGSSGSSARTAVNVLLSPSMILIVPFSRPSFPSLALPLPDKVQEGGPSYRGFNFFEPSEINSSMHLPLRALLEFTVECVRNFRGSLDHVLSRIHAEDDSNSLRIPSVEGGRQREVRLEFNRRKAS